MDSGSSIDIDHLQRFLLGGLAVATVKNEASGKRFTFRVKQAKESRDGEREPPHFVSVLTGSNNDPHGGDWTFLGMIWEGQRFTRVRTSKVDRGAPSFKAFDFVWGLAATRRAPPPSLRVWGSGECSRCRRALTSEWANVGLGHDCFLKSGGDPEVARAIRRAGRAAKR